MNREQYLRRLKVLLSDISEAERAEAMKYYEEYFEDANMPDEDVIRQLGSPEEVAASIHEELADKEIVGAYDSSEKEKSGVSIAWIVGLIICAPLIIALAGAVFSVTMALISLLIASSACSLAFGGATIVCLIVACIKLLVSPWATGILFGASLLCLGLCFLNILVTIKLCTFVIPGYFKGLGNLLSLPFRKKEAVAA